MTRQTPYLASLDRTTHTKSFLLFRVLSFPSCVGPFFSFINSHFDYFYRITAPRPEKILLNEFVDKAMYRESSSSASPPSTPLPSTPGSIRSRDLSTSFRSPYCSPSPLSVIYKALIVRNPTAGQPYLGHGLMALGAVLLKDKNTDSDVLTYISCSDD